MSRVNVFTKLKTDIVEQNFGGSANKNNTFSSVEILVDHAKGSDAAALSCSCGADKNARFDFRLPDSWTLSSIVNVEAGEFLSEVYTRAFEASTNELSKNPKISVGALIRHAIEKLTLFVNANGFSVGNIAFKKSFSVSIVHTIAIRAAFDCAMSHDRSDG